MLSIFHRGLREAAQRLGLACAAIVLISLAPRVEAQSPVSAPPLLAECRSSDLAGLAGNTVTTPGAWWNPKRDGTGWQFYYSGENGQYLNVAWFTYDQDKQPIWLLSSTGEVRTNESGLKYWQADLHQHSWVFGPGNEIGEKGPFAVVGSVAISFFADDPLRAVIRWQWNEAHPSTYFDECIRDFSRTDAAGPIGTNSVNAGYSGAWAELAQQKKGWGANVNVILIGTTSPASYLEATTLGIFDDTGRPVWLLGVDSVRSTPRPLGVALESPLILTYRVGTGYAGVPTTDCTSTTGNCTHEYPGIGSWNRIFQTPIAALGELSVYACPVGYLDGTCPGYRPLPSAANPIRRFDRPDSGQSGMVTMEKYTTADQILVDRALCVIPVGQSQCEVTVNWSSNPDTPVSGGQSFDPKIYKVQAGLREEIAAGVQGEIQVALLDQQRVHFELWNEQVSPHRLLSSSIEVLAVRSELDDPIADVPDQAAVGLDPEWTGHDATAGRTSGSAGVSGGSAAYSIPIEVPPGRNGMQPSLSLAYSSSGGNGIAGMGWSLSGLSSIHRCPQTVEQDGRALAVAFNGEDRLCLDGQRLVRVEGSAYGLNGAVYRTEVETFAKITQTGSLTASDSSFRVDYASGEWAEFGISASGRVTPTPPTGQTVVPLAWLIERSRDRTDNSVRYAYTIVGSGENLLQNVYYTGKGTVDGNRRVQLVYEDRPVGPGFNDRARSFLAGRPTQSTKRLKTIATWVGPTAPVREYRLDYGSGAAVGVPSASTGRSLLRGVQECAQATGAGMVCKPKTEFDWQEGAIGYTLTSTSPLAQLSELETDSQDFWLSVRFQPTGDFNGDGSRELIWQGPSATNPAVSERRLVSVRADRSLAWSFPIPAELGGLSGPNQANFYNRADFDMDGRVELVTRNAAGFLELRFWHGPANAASFETAFTRTRTTNVPLTEGLFANLIHAGDMDGDGWADLVVIAPATASSGLGFSGGRGCSSGFNFEVWKNPGDTSNSPTLAFTRIATMCTSGGTHPEGVARVSDFNGDGLPDIWTSSPQAGGADRHTSRILFGGINSSGVYFLTSTNFSTLLPSPQTDEQRKNVFHLWADINGDGLDDFLFVRVQSGSGYWAYRLNQGNTLGPRVHTTSSYGIETCSGTETECDDQWRPSHGSLIRVADIDGDGRAEILAPRDFAARVCGRRPEETPPGGQCNGVQDRVNEGEDDPELLALLNEQCQPTYFCPEHPVTGDLPGVIVGTANNQRRLILRTDANRNGNILDDPPSAFVEREVWPAYRNGGADWDRSSYFMGAMRFVETASNGLEVRTETTSIIANTQRPWLADDIYGDGHTDVPLMVGCYGGVLDCTIPFKVPGAANPLPESVSPTTLPGGIDLLTRKALLIEGVGPRSGGPGSPPRLNPDGKTPQTQDLMASVADGLGGVAAWTYYPLSSKAGRNPTNETPLYRVPDENLAARYIDDRHTYFTSSMPVVGDFAVSDGVGDVRNMRYGYEEAMYHQRGRGFQGFRTVIEEDETAGIRTTTRFHQKFPLTGRIEEQIRNATVRTGANAPFERTVFDWRCNRATNGTCAAPATPLVTATFPFLREQHTWTYDASVAGAASGTPQEMGYRRTVNAQWTFTASDCEGSPATASGFDEFGNLVHSYTRQEDRGADLAVTAQCEKTHASYSPQESVWWINKLDASTVERRIAFASGHTLPTGASNPNHVLTTSYTWNADRTLSTETVQPDITHQQVTTVYGYPSPSHGLPSSIAVTASGDTNPGARTTTIQYSSDGYFTESVTNPAWRVATTVHRERDGQPQQITDANDLKTKFFYDAFGYLERTEFRDFADTVNRLPPQYRGMIRCTPATGCPAHAVFQEMVVQEGSPSAVTHLDLLGRTLGSKSRLADLSWSQQRVEYNARGLVERQSTPHRPLESAQWTTFSGFDLLGRPTQKLEPRGLLDIDGLNQGDLRTTYTYTGRKTAIQVCGTTAFPVANCLNLSRVSDSLGRVVSTFDALSGRTRYWHDPAGNAIALEDAKSVVTRAHYNASGHRTQVNDPNQGTWIFTYNALGELLTQTDARGTATTFRYDRLGRMTERDAQVEIDLNSPGLERVVDLFSFDPANGKGLPAGSSRSLFTNSGGILRTERIEALIYDHFARLETRDIRQYVGPNTSLKTYLHRWAYDGRYGRPKAEAWPNQVGVQMLYGFYGHASQSRSPNPAMPEVYWSLENVNGRGQSTREYVGPFERNTEYADTTGQALAIEYRHGGVSKRRQEYRHDVFGNLTQRTLNPWLGASAPSERFTYDKLHRLTQANRTHLASGSVGYGYDQVGNFTLKTDYGSSYLYGNATKSAGGNAGANAVRQVTLATPVAGQTIVGMTYDNNGNLTASTLAAAPFQARYDHMNLPLFVQRAAAVAEFAYAADGSRARQWGGEGHRIYLPSFEDVVASPISEVESRAYLGDYAVLSRRPENNTLAVEYLLTDRLGSVDAIGQTNGEVMHQRGYDAFGKPRSGDWSDLVPPMLSTISMTVTQKGFTQHEHLNNVQLIHMNGRGYDFNLGRFLSVDPFIQFPLNSQSLNPYSYILNNPMSGTDPTGYCVAETGTRIKSCANVSAEMSDGSTKKLGSFNTRNQADMARAERISVPGLGGGIAVERAAPHIAGNGATAQGSYGVQRTDGSAAGASGVGGGKTKNGAVTAASNYSLGQMEPTAYQSTGPDIGLTVDPTPDSAGDERLSTFYKAMASAGRSGIEFGEGTRTIYVDSYAYFREDKLMYCSVNCDNALERFGMVTGKYDKVANRITLFRGAVEPQWISGETGYSIWSKRLTRTGVESAIWTLGHEAAHSRGIDLDIPGRAFHWNAERAGQQALDQYRSWRSEP